MASPNPSGTDDASGNEVAIALVGVVQRMIEEAVRRQVQEAVREQVQEALRLQEERTAASLRQMEQQLRGRDDAISALQHSLDEGEQRLEARVAALEEQARPSSAKGESERAGEQGALGRLESRMAKLEGAMQTALAGVFPRVEALVKRLETSPPRAPLSPSSVTTSSAPQPPAASVARGASEAKEAAAAADVRIDRLKLAVERRIKEVEWQMLRAQAIPSFLGEALCKTTNLDEIRRLLDSGADVNYVNSLGKCPLISARLADGDCGYIPEVQSLLLARGADANSIDSEGRSALHLAIGGENVGLLIAAGADVNVRDRDGATPLHWAASALDVRAIRSLVAAGADKNLRCWSGTYENRIPFDIAPSEVTRDLLRP